MGQNLSSHGAKIPRKVGMWFLKLLLLVGTVGMFQDYVFKDKRETRVHLIKIVDNDEGKKETEKFAATMIMKKINLGLISKTLAPY